MNSTYDELKKLEFNKEEILDLINKMENLFAELKNSQDIERILNLLEEINEIRDHYLTKYWLSYIGYLLNTKDPKYLASEKVMGQLDPIMDNLKKRYYQIICNLEFKKDIEKILGSRLLSIAKNEAVLQNDKIIKLISKEKQLHKQYLNLIINTKFSFDDKEMNLAGLNKSLVDSDAKIRKNAFDKRFEILISLEKEIDDIYDELIKIRTEEAKVLGFDSYTEIGLIQMNRIGYGVKEITKFRNEVKKYFIPLMKKLREMQKERLGTQKLNYYDRALLFPDGNAKVILDLPEVLSATSKILGYNSGECQKIFDLMIQNGFIDLSDNPEKSNGGITTYLPDYQMPMFIKKYQGLDDNITTIHHEFGHCAQLYFSRNLKYHENRWPTFDICEIHSTTMEFLMYPHLEEYFGKDKKKYKIKHLTKIIAMIISKCLDDEFQQYLYDNPLKTPEERKNKWLEQCKEYSACEDKSHEYMIKGIDWQANSNNIDTPFYCIDYALAGIISLSFYEKIRENEKEAWDDFIKLCQFGGSKSLEEITRLVNLNNPFNEEDVKNAAAFLEKEIKLLL